MNRRQLLLLCKGHRRHQYTEARQIQHNTFRWLYFFPEHIDASDQKAQENHSERFRGWKKSDSPFLPAATRLGDYWVEIEEPVSGNSLGGRLAGPMEL